MISFPRAISATLANASRTPAFSALRLSSVSKRHVKTFALGQRGSSREFFPAGYRSFHSTSVSRSPASSQHPVVLAELPSGEKKNLPSRWLRDHCHCKECVNQDTLQRSFDSFANTDRTPQTVVATDSALQITWQETGHVSSYPWEWLSKNVEQKPSQIKRTFWDADIAKNPPSVHYDEIMASDAGVGKWTSRILEHGFCFVDGCPVSPAATEKLLERIAFIRVTHYGGFYDFTSDLTHKDTAYTTLGLPAHTDTTYFTDPAGLQMFHLLSHTEGSGGASLLVDGFSCAEQLREKYPEAYEILAKTPVPSHASGNEGIVITPAARFPVFNHDRETGELVQLRWNSDDRATMSVEPAPGVSFDDWFEAARLWNKVITEKKNEYWEQLVPGRPLIFDNWRVMHARSAFTGKRRIAGGYINRDDFISRYWNTNFTREEVLKRII